VIGGSGLYEIDGLEDVRETALSTPFGEPSDAYVQGVLDGVRMVFLPRHGRGHRILPSEINFRANVWGLKAAARLPHVEMARLTGLCRFLSVHLYGPL
jgi:5'-methylthioadenosine phosphorylase